MIALASLPLWNERVHLVARCGRYRSAKKAITTPTWPLEA